MIKQLTTKLKQCKIMLRENWKTESFMTQKSKTNNKPYGHYSLSKEIRDLNKGTFENFIHKFHDDDEIIRDFCSNFIYKTPKTTITLPYHHALKNTDCITFLNNFHFLKNGFLDKNNIKKK